MDGAETRTERQERWFEIEFILEAHGAVRAPKFLDEKLDEDGKKAILAFVACVPFEAPSDASRSTPKTGRIVLSVSLWLLLGFNNLPSLVLLSSPMQSFTITPAKTRAGGWS